jgi:hypothetical protein
VLNANVYMSMTHTEILVILLLSKQCMFLVCAYVMSNLVQRFGAERHPVVHNATKDQILILHQYTDEVG